MRRFSFSFKKKINLDYNLFIFFENIDINVPGGARTHNLGLIRTTH